MSIKDPEQPETEPQQKPNRALLPTTVEGMLEYMAERIRLGKDVRQGDLKQLYIDIAPASVESTRIRLKTEAFPFSEWLLDNVLHDMSAWSEDIGRGGYYLSEVNSVTRTLKPYLFEVAGYFFIPAAQKDNVRVLSYHQQRHYIHVEIDVLIETRIDVIVRCCGPRSISVLWDAYRQIVDQIEAHAETLNRQAEPYAYEGGMVYLHRRKPNPEIVKRNAEIRAAADSGTRHKELCKQYDLSINTIKTILRQERRKKPAS